MTVLVEYHGECCWNNFSINLGMFQILITWHSLSFPDRVVSSSTAYGDVLEVSPDNKTLRFLPFASEKYSSAIHATSYQCRATNEMGSIESTTVDIRAGKE
jgi:hypothetical protein